MAEEEELAEIAVADPEPAAEEAEWDSVLEMMDSSEEDVGVIGTSDAPDKLGTGTKDPEPAKADSAPEQEENTDADNDADREQPEAEDAGLEKALAAIRRDGLPQSVIEKMTNEEILALGSKRSKVQSDTDDAYRQLQDMKKAEETAQENEPDTVQPDQPKLADLEQAVQPFADIFGKDAGEALKAAQQDALAPLIERLESTQRMVEGVLLESSRGQLTERYPQLSQDEHYVRVKTRMESLVKTGDYKDMAELMSDAARIEFSEETATVSRELKERRQHQKDEGQMMPVDKAETPAHAMSTDEREAALLDALEGGMKVSDARRQFGV